MIIAYVRVIGTFYAHNIVKWFFICNHKMFQKGYSSENLEKFILKV